MAQVNKEYDRDRSLSKPLPSNPEAEKTILGAILIDNSLINEAIEFLKPNMFYSPLNKTVFQAMINLYIAEKPIDAILVGEELKKTTSLETIGGITTIAGLMYGLPTFRNISNYIKIVVTKHKSREFIKACGLAVTKALDEDEEISSVMEVHESTVFNLSQGNLSKHKSLTVGEMVNDKIKAIQTQARSESKIIGLTTGYKDLDVLMGGMRKKNLIVVAARPSMGKLQSLDSIVYTPKGKTTMGEIRLNDSVIGFDGKAKKVTGIFPQGIVDIYSVNFSDGTSTECGLEHLWYVRSRLDRQSDREGQVLTTKQIMSKLTVGIKTDRLNYSVPYIKPVEFEGSITKIHPYLLGALIADGSLGKSIQYSKTDKQIIERVQYLMPYNELVCYNDIGKDWKILKGRSSKSIWNFINELGLRNKKSYEKFIPKEYLYGTIESRVELMRGLFDGDGHIQKTGWVEYSTTSKQLADDVRELVLSLGARATISQKMGRYKKNGVHIETRIAYRVRIKFQNQEINPFWCTRKSFAYSQTKVKNLPKFIKSVEYVGKKEAQCIMVDCPKHLYATDDFILTHNSTICLNIAQNVVDTDIEKTAVVAIFSIEMNKDELMEKFISADTKIDSKRIEQGFLARDEWVKLAESGIKFSEQQIIIEDFENIDEDITPLKIKAMARKIMTERKRLDLIVIDHLTLMKGSQKKYESTQKEISEITRELKAMAKALDVPVILIAQLNRECEKRKPPIPIMSDLRDSGGIEENADVCAFIYRESYYNETEDNKTEANVYVRKNRNGATGRAKLSFFREYSRFENREL